MRTIMTLRLIMIVISITQGTCYGTGGGSSFYKDHAHGWHWYEEILSEEETPKNIEKVESEVSKQREKSASDIVKSYKKELEKRLHQAWLHPTPENVSSYQMMQKDMTERSKIFSDVWMNNVYTNPALDQTIVNPVNQKAGHIHNDIEKKKIRETIKNLSKEYGLFFFFSSRCSYCHSFAPIVKQFSQQYGWDVLAISLDGGSIEEFPDAVPDNGLSVTWDIQALPSLYAVNPHTEHVIPIAHGMVGIDEMEIRLMKLLEKKS